MKLLEMRCLTGPNYWSVRRPTLVVMKLDLESLEERPTNQIEGFYDRLRTLLPSLYEHRCSEGRPGGFFHRVELGTWMGHVIEHLALELQTLAGMDCGFGRTRSTGERGVYNVVFSYEIEPAGRLAGQQAVALAQALVEGADFDLPPVVAELRRLYFAHKLGPSTSSIVNACRRKGVPFLRLDEDSTVQLGYGAKQKRIQATVSSQTSALGVELAADKADTKRVLLRHGVPVPQGVVVSTEDELRTALAEFRGPLVIKPLDGNHGRGVTTNLRTTEAALAAFQLAQQHSESVVLETFAEGDDYRLLVVDYKLVAAARRVPACVTGDGVSTLRVLVDDANQDPRRGCGHENILTRIEADEATLRLLEKGGLTLDSVPSCGQVVFLKTTANLSTGGTSVDVTDEVHPEIAFMAERAARAIGLDICGIDLLATNITLPLKTSGATVIEVNAGPGFRMHTHPTEGKPRDVGRCIADMLFPGDENGRIPILAVTGTNGKTTTTRLLAHLMKTAGHRVGFTTTEGIYIDGFQVEEGDCTGPISNRKVLMDASVEVAVLECARGGMLRSGLAFDQCDVGIVTNVAADHLGLRDIHTVDDMARVKAIVAESVKPTGYAVLNADNEHTATMRDRVTCNVAMFTTCPRNRRVTEHCAEGGLAAVLDEGFVAIWRGSERLKVEAVANIPLAFGGRATFMVENILAATLGAYCQGVPVALIAEGLRSFVPSGETTPGRMNFFQFDGFQVMVDYAHNPHGLAALGGFIRSVPADCRQGILTGVGDRRDEDIRLLGKVAAEIFDDIIVRMDDDSRGRTTEEIMRLVTEGIRLVDADAAIRCIPDELEAIEFAIRHARPGQFVVLLSDKIKESLELVRGLQRQQQNRAEAEMQVV